MKINEPFEIQKCAQFSGCVVLAMDDGAYLEMDSPRARRIAKLWNAALGVPTDQLPKRIRGRRKKEEQP